MNPAAWVERHARRRPDDPALADGDRVCANWGEFAARTAGAATSLRDHVGLSPGDRVAIVMRNRPEYLEALFAIWHAGLVAVPVNARLHLCPPQGARRNVMRGSPRRRSERIMPHAVAGLNIGIVGDAV